MIYFGFKKFPDVGNLFCCFIVLISTERFLFEKRFLSYCFVNSSLLLKYFNVRGTKSTLWIDLVSFLQRTYAEEKLYFQDVSIDLMLMMLITTGLFPLLQYGPFTSLSGDISQHLTRLWMDHLFVLPNWNICCAVNCTDVNINSYTTSRPCDVQQFSHVLLSWAHCLGVTDVPSDLVRRPKLWANKGENIGFRYLLPAQLLKKKMKTVKCDFTWRG